jgi:soluble lytic murein transglycosylase-like protein
MATFMHWLPWMLAGFVIFLLFDDPPYKGLRRTSVPLIIIIVCLVMLVGYSGKACAQQVPQAAARYRLELTRTAHSQWGLDAPVAALAAQVHQESGWNPLAVSRVGATGMAQFMPSTASWWCNLQALQGAACNPSNPTWALRALVGYDKWLFDRVRARDKVNQLAFALSAYNGGLGWVNRDKPLASNKGFDTLAWFDSVETVNAGRTAANWRENRDYPRRILLRIAPAYIAAGWSAGAFT